MLDMITRETMLAGNSITAAFFIRTWVGIVDNTFVVVITRAGGMGGVRCPQLGSSLGQCY